MFTVIEIFRDVCLPIMLLIVVGWVMDRKFDLKLDTLVKLNIYLFVPSFIFVRVSSSDLQQGMGGKVVLFTLCVLAVMYGLSAGVSFLRKESEQQRMGLQLSTMFYNSGNWGIPLMALAFPEVGPVIQVFVLMTMNISTFSIGIFLASAQGEGKAKAGLWQRFSPMLRQPSIYAILLALLMRSMGNPLEEVVFIWKPMTYLADALVAFALITLGVQLSKTRPPKIEGRLAWVLGIRLLGGPAAAFFLTRLFAFDAVTSAVLIVGAASPVAVNTALLAHEFKADSRFAAAAVFYSTLLAGLVVTGLIYFLR
ncbi:MAG: AEC family transporter [Verrucomicrobiota bacterium]